MAVRVFKVALFLLVVKHTASEYQFPLDNKKLSIPSPVLDVLMSESSLVPFWDSRYVAGTQPCSSAVLTNHQPTKRSKRSCSVNSKRNMNSGMLLRSKHRVRSFGAGLSYPVVS